MNNINYFLVLEKRIGDYNLIDINKLDICENPVYNNIASLDAFSIKFSDEEIKASIARSNMASNYLDGTLKIISDAKNPHNLKVITKDVYDTIINFQNSEEKMNQQIKNVIFGTYKKIIESSFSDPDFIHGLLERLKLDLKGNDKRGTFSLIEEMPYEKIRNIYLAIYREEKKQKEMLRNLKLNEAA